MDGATPPRMRGYIIFIMADDQPKKSGTVFGKFISTPFRALMCFIICYALHSEVRHVWIGKMMRR